MAKSKTAFFCQNCGVQSPKWIGKCPSCGEWNTYVEEVLVSKKEQKSWNTNTKPQTNKAHKIQEVEILKEHRIKVQDHELNRVLGGGIVPGSIVLLGGEPGIGKSTLLLQFALQMQNLKVLYVSGEESNQQIKMRADRLGISNENCYLLNETSVQHIFQQVVNVEPHVLIIDSIQTLHTDELDASPGSISQIRECTHELQKYAKASNTPIFLIGHITKDGMIAGPKVLEHIVDTVLQFEGERNYNYRILRSIKNRFGSSHEIGIYEMTEKGLKEIANPSEFLISQRQSNISGISIACTIEGMRPMLIETQALVSSAVYGTPQRSTTGFDYKRLNMLLAVLEKRCGFRLGVKDVFLNITGGLKINDPAIDLAVATAILSSNQDQAIAPNIAFIGEIGLTGEVRAVNRMEQRISEVDKQGFEKVFLSKHGLKGINQKKYKVEIIGVQQINQVYASLF